MRWIAAKPATSDLCRSAAEGFGVRKPKAERKYDLVRVTGDRVEQAEFTRFGDDSVFIVAEGYQTVIEFAPGAWEQAWADLESRGFVELEQARAAGLLPPGWAADAEPGAAPDTGRGPGFFDV